MQEYSGVERVSSVKAALSYLTVALFLFFEMGIQVSPSVMTDQLMRSMQIGAFGLGLMSGFYFYTYTLMQIPSGLIFDRFEPRFVIAASIIVCSVGCLCFGLSSNLVLGSLSRMLMGFGSAFAFVAVLVVTADLFAPRYFAFITGITQMLAAFGAMSGQMPLSFVVSHLGWRKTMFVLAAIGFVLALTVWIFLNYKKDLLNKKPDNGETNVSLKFSDIFSNSQTWFIGLYACLLWAPMSGFASLWGVPFLQKVLMLTKQSAALTCSMMWLGLAVLSPVLGHLSTIFKTRVWPLAFSALMGAVAFGLLLILKSASIEWVALLVFLAGAACAGQALSFTVVREINNAAQRATAIAFNNLAVVISGAIFQPALGKILSIQCDVVGESLSLCQQHHFRLSMILLFAAYVGAFLLAVFFIRESYKE